MEKHCNLQCVPSTLARSVGVHEYTQAQAPRLGAGLKQGSAVPAWLCSDWLCHLG